MSEFLDWCLKYLPLIIVAGGGISWLYVRRKDWVSGKRAERKEERDEGRAVLTDEFTRLRTANEDLSEQLSQFAPHLTQLRKEYAEAIQREVFLLDQLRNLTAQSAVAAHERVRLRDALVEVSTQLTLLRQMMTEAGMDLPPEADLSGVQSILDEVFLPAQGLPASKPDGR